jgi:hypothetical protein
MRKSSVLFCLFSFVSFVSCTPKEEEQEPDYEHMVMADDEEEWSTGDRKIIVSDLPDPQEQVILEVPEAKQVIR